MAKTSALLVLAVAGTVVALWAISARRDHEPVYKGQTLTEWLTVFATNDTAAASSARDTARGAVNAIGTNALPLLVKWIGYDVPQWQIDSLSAGVNPGDLTRTVMGKKLLKIHAAMDGFEILGPTAAPAVPALSRWLAQEDPLARSGRILEALMWVGQPAVPALVAVITNRTNPTALRRKAAEQLGFVLFNHPVTQWITPDVVACLNEKEVVAPAMALAVGYAPERSEVVVPALIRCLRNGKSELKNNTVRSIGAYGKAATNAVPYLLAFTTNADPQVRSDATRSLRNIAPEVWRDSVKQHP